MLLCSSRLSILVSARAAAAVRPAILRQPPLLQRSHLLRLFASMGRKDGNSAHGMSAQRNHNNVPVKDCVTCGRPFTWRKKWEKCWDEVLTCSERCKRDRRSKGKQDGRGAGIAAAIAMAGTGSRRGATCEGSSGSDDDEGRETVAGTEMAAPQLVQSTKCDDSSCSNDDDGRVTTANSGTADPQPLQGKVDSSGGSFVPDVEASGHFEKLIEELVQELDSQHGSSSETCNAPVSPRTARRAHKQAVKAAKRAQRSSSPGAVAAKQKPCDECERPVDLLIRCTSDSSQQWNMLCGRCWKGASGGVPDGDADHPHYRYGGIWKNRAACTSTPSFSGRQREAMGVS